MYISGWIFFGSHMLLLPEHIDVILLAGNMWYIEMTSTFQSMRKPFMLLYWYIRVENHQIPYEPKLIYNIT